MKSTVEEILDLLRGSADLGYFGEPVTQSSTRSSARNAQR